jgi:hypothetical protein
MSTGLKWLIISLLSSEKSHFCLIIEIISHLNFSSGIKTKLNHYHVYTDHVVTITREGTHKFR